MLSCLVCSEHGILMINCLQGWPASEGFQATGVCHQPEASPQAQANPSRAAPTAGSQAPADSRGIG